MHKTLPRLRRTLSGNVAWASLLALATPLTAAPIDYHTDIAPLLRDYCAGCHNGGDYEGGFSVETFAELMEGGESEDETILVPGHPDRSYLLQTIRKTTKPAMPPKKEPQPSAAEIALLTRWIEEGAKGPAREHDHSLLSTLNVPGIAPTAAVKDAVTATAFASGGSLKAFAKHGRIELVGPDDKHVRDLPTPQGKINALHFSSDGTRLVAATGIAGLKGAAIVFAVGSGEVVLTLGGDVHRDILFDAEFSPDGTLLATAGYDRDIHLWDLASGKALRSFTSHNAAVYDLAFSPDGTVLASASGDGTCKIWRVATGERLDTLNQPEAEQYRVAFTPDARHIVAAGADNRIRLWRFVSKAEPRINPLLQTRFGHEDAIVGFALSPDGGRLVTTSADRSLKLWSLPELQPLKDFGVQSDVVAALAFTGEEGTFFASRLDGSQERFSFDGVAKIASVAAVSPISAATPAPAEAETRMLTEALSGKNPALLRRSEVKGTIAAPGEHDEYPFHAKAGETWVFEVNAARAKSKLDSKLAVLDAAGEPVEQVVLQALRDSWLTFRGKDSKTSNDFRVHNWEEMELNELLYVNGEVVKLHLYPRGPDSGFKVYPGFGNRRTWFQTTPMSHPLGQPCYIVRALSPGSEPVDNGLPVYRLYYENDDDPERRLGSDSVLRFTAPADGDYSVRIGDVRGFGGEGYDYTLLARHLRPDFSVALDTKEITIAPGSGKELLFTATRSDGFNGPVSLEIGGLPDSLSVPGGLTIEAGQDRAHTLLSAGKEFAGLTEAEAAAVTITARGEVGGKGVERTVGALPPVGVLADKKLRVALQPDGDSGHFADDGVLEFTIRPGGTITALVTVERNGFTGEIPFGKEDAGRNLPHGVYVDNIGLNGLMIQEGRSEQRVFITSAKIVPETTRLFHLVTTVEGGHGTPPARIRVVRDTVAAKKE